MKIEEARVVWLTTFGSGWVDMADVLKAKGIYPWDAYHTLNDANALEDDKSNATVKLKCKS
jgi:hypothetical protein